MRILLAASLALFSTVALGDAFTYVLPHFSTSQGECEDAGVAVFENFGARTGRETVGFECARESRASFKLVIQYDATEKLRVTSNFSDDLDPGRKPLYRDLSECRQALEDEAAVLMSVTELPLLSAYCQFIEVAYERWFVPKVDVLGHSEYL